MGITLFEYAITKLDISGSPLMNAEPKAWKLLLKPATNNNFYYTILLYLFLVAGAAAAIYYFIIPLLI